MNPETLSETCLPNDPESVSRARGEVREWLGKDHPAYENARLAVSELVTNAVRHAGGGPTGDPGTVGGSLPVGVLRAVGGSLPAGDPGTVGGSLSGEISGAVPYSGAGSLVLRLSALGDLLRIEVVDQGWSTREPRLRADPAFPLAEGGRGLAIVSALSGGNWGYRSHGPGLGRTVWCEIPADPQPSEDPLLDLQDLPDLTGLPGLADLERGAGLGRSLPEGPVKDLVSDTPAFLGWPGCGGLSTQVWWLPPRPE
ncbi:ATP-binding protein [Streptosporangium sp. NPDC051023]|uniref:ATP-binding protein n=1 Tax=Streptosporangium sp. NPDC051023 TaxID=3155410 RepID=UPI00344D0981